MLGCRYGIISSSPQKNVAFGLRLWLDTTQTTSLFTNQAGTTNVVNDLDSVNYIKNMAIIGGYIQTAGAPSTNIKYRKAFKNGKDTINWSTSAGYTTSNFYMPDIFNGCDITGASLFLVCQMGVNYLFRYTKDTSITTVDTSGNFSIRFGGASKFAVNLARGFGWCLVYIIANPASNSSIMQTRIGKTWGTQQSMAYDATFFQNNTFINSSLSHMIFGEMRIYNRPLTGTDLNNTLTELITKWDV